MSDTDPILWPTQTTPSQGKTCNLQEEKPCSWGRKNPMSHLSRMKNTNLPCPSVAAALQAYGYVLPPWVFELLGNHCFLLSLSRAVKPCQLIASHILTIPCVLSLVLTIAICALPPPPQSHRRRKGDSSVNYRNTNKRAGYVLLCFGYLLCLGPSQALSKGHHSVERRQGKPWVVIQAARQYSVVDAGE